MNAKSLLPVLIIFATSAALSQTLSSVQTVEQLIAAENARAMILSKLDDAKKIAEVRKELTMQEQLAAAESAAKSATVKGKSAPAAQPNAAQVSVEAIYGSAGSLFVDLRIDGKSHHKKSATDTVGDCRIVAIEPRAVRMESVTTTKCPASVGWTGVNVVIPPSASVPSDGQGAPFNRLPLPLPTRASSLPSTQQ